MDPARRRHLALALFYLARARAWHAARPVSASFARLRAGAGQGSAAGGGAAPDPALMLWALEAAGKRVPWRADCVVQALAAKFWLEAAGREAEFRLGVRRTEAGSLEAHAWLEVGGRAVSGGAPSGALARFGRADGGDGAAPPPG